MKKIANIVLNDFVNDGRVLNTSKTLSSLDYKVVVVAMHSFELLEKEVVSGIDVERIKLTSRPWPKNKIIQFVKYFEFICRAFFRFRKFDVIHCNDLNALPIGVLIKIFCKEVKVVYDCHEYETERGGGNKISKWLMKFFEKNLIRYVDSIITVSDSIAACYSKDYGIVKPHLVLNCPSYTEQERFDLFRKNLNIRTNQTIFLYQGGLGFGRGIELLLEAFFGVNNDENVLVFMGCGPLESLIKEKAETFNNIFFHPAVSPDVLLNYTASADYGILFYEDTCLNHRYCSPNKIFEYLMAGLPVLTSNLYEMKRLVKSEGVGIVAEANTVDGFRGAISASLSQDYEEIQSNVFEARKKYCWEEQEKVIKEIYNAL
jgi:glycosyltransferase involved in cell wall biosynthesis